MSVFEIKQAGERKGRGLFATKRITKGEIVLQEEPYAFSVYPHAREKYCNYSLAPPAEGENLKRCSKTKMSYFKDKECIQKAWTEHDYKRESKSIVKLRQYNEAAEFPAPLLFAAKVCWKMQRGKKEAQMIHNLSCEWEKEPKERIDEHKHLATMLSIFVDGYQADEEVIVEYAQILSKLNTNSFSIVGPDMETVAMAIFPNFGAMANHSMTPNSVPAFCLGECGKLTLLALRDIEAGEEITVSYVPAESSYMQRQWTLKDSYYFTCGENNDDLQRRLIHSYKSPSTAKTINIYQLSPEDQGLDIQLVKPEENLEFYVRNVEKSPDEWESTIESWLSNIISYNPVPSLPLQHPMNLQILREKYENDATYESLKEFVAAAETLDFCWYPMFWLAKVDLLTLFPEKFEPAALMEASADVIKNFEYYLKHIGKCGTDRLCALELMAANPDMYLQMQLKSQD